MFIPPPINDAYASLEAAETVENEHVRTKELSVGCLIEVFGAVRCDLLKDQRKEAMCKFHTNVVMNRKAIV